MPTRILRAVERIVWGGPLRGRLIERLFVGYHRSLYRRTWAWVPEGEQPHFFDHRLGAALVAVGDGTPYGWFRGFYAAEVLRPEDRVLDIGCGDGFFDSRFLAARCSSVDAVDVEASAIEHARRHSAAPNVTYRLLDAVDEGFPNPPYDVIVWDGAIGHFSAPETERMLDKIRASLAPEGVFAGSESIGVEGHDHLQFFQSLDDMRQLLERYFPHVELRQMSYALSNGGPVRAEGYWRCANEPGRLEEAAWRRGG